MKDSVLGRFDLLCVEGFPIDHQVASRGVLQSSVPVTARPAV